MSLRTKGQAPTSNKNKVATPKKSNAEIIKILREVTIRDNEFLFEDDDIIKELASIKTVDGDFLLNENYPNLLFEIIGGFAKLNKEKIDFGKAIEYIKVVIKDNNFSLRDEDFTIIFKLPWFLEEQRNYLGTINRMKTKISVKKGIFKCPECIKNKRTPVNDTESVEVMSRSADEPMDVYNTCNNCGYKWKI